VGVGEGRVRVGLVLDRCRVTIGFRLGWDRVSVECVLG
jgi:hypothetical protein